MAPRRLGRGGWGIIVTSEHGGNDVPPGWRHAFEGHDALLASHRGWDPGTLGLAKTLAQRLDAALVAATTTRLLVDLNRSPDNPRVFSTITRRLPREGRRELLEHYHAPHWRAVHEAVASALRQSGRALHLSVHSFTPVLDGAIRKPDLALLYDPARAAERSFAAGWIHELRAVAPDRVLRRNDPYRGAADGLTTALRREHPETRYLGIELEVNQRHVGGDGRFPPWIADALMRSLEGVLWAPR